MSNLRGFQFQHRGSSTTYTSSSGNGRNFPGPGMILGTGAITSAQGPAPAMPPNQSPGSTSSQRPATIIDNASTPSPRAELTEKDVKFAFICKEIFEYDAMIDALDVVGKHFPWDGRHGSVPYRSGFIKDHLVVVTTLSEQGRADVAIVATNLKDNFPGILLIVLVGTCSAVPYNPKSPSQDVINLGDVIFSTQVQPYLRGAHFGTRLNRIDTIPQDASDRKVLKLVTMAQSRIDRRELTLLVEEEFGELQRKHKSYQYPDLHSSRDILYRSSYPHVHRNDTCPESRQERKCNLRLSTACERARRSSCRELNCDHLQASRIRKNADRGFAIHWGIFASGEVEMGDAAHRDSIARNEQVCAFETEASGMWQGGPALIVKGASDYADNHNDRGWKTYAAGRAASGAKALVMQCWPSDLRTC